MVSAEEGEAGHGSGEEESWSENDEDSMIWEKKLAMTRQPCERRSTLHQPQMCKIRRLFYSHHRCSLL